MLVVLMPLSQYKKKELYRHVDTFELADPSLFEDAVITENLCICSLKKENADKYDWMDIALSLLTLSSCWVNRCLAATSIKVISMLAWLRAWLGLLWVVKFYLSKQA